MQKREIYDVDKAQAREYAKTVLKQALSCRVTDIRYLGGGSFGFVYRAEIDCPPYTVVMKACRTAGVCGREAAELALLGEDALIPVPRVYFTFTATEAVPMDFIGMELAGGTDCFTDWRKLLRSKKEKAAFAEEVTAALYHWHSRTNDRFGLIGNAVYDEWLDFYRPFAADILAGARELTRSGKLERKVLAAMERAWDAFDFIFSERVETACLIHGDMNVMNIMADKRLKPVAIIDPLESKWADREYELFQLRNLTGDRFGLYQTYCRNYPVSQKCDIKTAFYGLYHEVYAYLLSGNKVNYILMPLVRRMNRELKNYGF